MPLTLEKKIAAGFAAAVGFMLLLGGTAWWSAVRSAETFRWVDHTHEVLYQLEACLADMLNMQTATRGYLLTNQESFLEPYTTGSTRIGANLTKLRELTQDSPAQRERAERLEQVMNRVMGILEERLRLGREQNFTPAREAASLEAGNAAITEVRRVISEMETVERRLLAERSAAAQAGQRRAVLVFGCGSAIAILVVVGAGIMVRRDFLQRVKAEAERDRFFSLSVDLLCISSTDGYFKRVSPAVTDILGWTVPEFLAKPYIDLVHPDDQAATRREVERQVATGERVLQFENRYRHKNGSWRVLSWRSVPQDGLMYAIARDVTELKAAEEKIHRQNRQLSTIFESLPGPSLVLTPDLRIVTATDAYLKATMTERQKIQGRPLFEVFPDNPGDPASDGVRNLRASLDRVTQTAAPDTMAIQKYDVRRPDGTFEERFWSPINSPVLGADRRIEYIIHRVEDVTAYVRARDAAPEAEQDLRIQLERMQAEVYQSGHQVQAAKRQLEAANKELEAFSYSVSHDLRAPLRHIDGFAGLLQKHSASVLDEQGRRYLSTISASARQMGRLIDDLLSFSRMGRTALQLREVTDHDALVANVIREGRWDRPERPITWQIAPLPPVHADQPMLQQVWANLLDNAVKYSGKVSEPRIEIGARTDPAAGEHVFFVRDNGAGFDMRYADKLFGVFQRLHGPAEFEGTGIGLANVRRIILRHGGRTWAEGAPGRGATFHFALPIHPHHDAA